MSQRPFPAYKGELPYVFVSYSHADAARVYPLLLLLREQGLKLWYDEGLEPGSSWRAGLADSIQGCEQVLFLVSEQSANSRNCEREIEYALSKNKSICVSYLERTQLPPSLDFSLGSEQAIFADHYEWTLFAKKVGQALLDRVEQSAAVQRKPSIPSYQASSPLVERDAVLEQVFSRLEEARKGRGGLVLVSGEAGIGKTTLLHQFRRQQPADCSILWGGCDALFTPRALGPIQDMAPDLGLPVQRALAQGTASSRLFNLLLERLEGQTKPTVLVIEDVHWADYATLDLIKYLARRITLLNVLLILSFRSDELGSDHPLNQVLGDLPSTHTLRLKLEPLTRAGVAQLASQASLPVDRLYEVTAGNPFFVTELIAAHSLDSSVPASVRDAVGSRLQRLEPKLRNFMETLSVVPGTVSSGLVGQLYATEGQDLSAACVERGLLLEEGRGYRFRHELARLATLGRSTEAKKQQAHRKVLQALQDLPESPAFDEMVHHAKGAFDGPAVLRWGAAAAKQAAAIGAHREAAAHLASALGFIDDATPEQAAQLYEDWAYEAGLALQIDDEVIAARSKAVSLWRALNRMDKVGENLRWLSRLHWYRGEAAEASRLADEAVTTLEQVPASVERGMAYSLRSQLHMLNDRMDEAIDWGRRALKLADEFDNAEVKIHAMNNVGTALLFRGRPGGREMMEQSLALAREHEHHEHAARVYTNLAEYGVETRDFALAEQVVSDGIAFDTQHDLDAWTHYLVGRLAQLRLEQGRLQDARTIAEGVLNLQQLTLLMYLPARIVLAKASVRLGSANAAELLERALEDAQATGERQYIFPVRIGQVEQLWLAGRIEDARRLLLQLLQDGTDLLRTWDLGEVAVWARRLKLEIPAELLTELPEGYRQEAQGQAGAAADHWQAIGAPYQACLALAASSDVQGAQRALDIAASIGAQGAVDKILRAAQEQGAKLTTSASGGGSSHPLGLSPREQAILRRLVAGASNQEMASELQRSQRTVSRNVASLLAKMGVENRIDAMLRVKNEPWLVDGSS